MPYNEKTQGVMMDQVIDVSPFVSAEAYRVGQKDGFRSGLVAGVVLVLLVKAVRNRNNKRPQFRINKNNK